LDQADSEAVLGQLRPLRRRELVEQQAAAAADDQGVLGPAPLVGRDERAVERFGVQGSARIAG
jgi:hypothetical protein